MKSTNDFINVAVTVHGSKYDYSESNYTGAKTNIKIICPDHGEFMQTPTNHLSGSGCRKCGYTKISKQMQDTVEKFIEKANNVHDEQYDYSDVKYVNSSTKVTINCLKHGKFSQLPNSHLRGSGCPECYGTKKKTNEDFVKTARLIHGSVYDYSKVNYINNRTKVIIICNEHSEFEQQAGSHLRGVGCPECFGKKKRTIEIFVNASKIVHGDKYDYSKVDYVNDKTRVTIICSIHKEFNQTPSHHLQGYGCRKCSKHPVTDTAEFITRANILHGDLYDYSNVEYTKSNKKVIIICRIHGPFQQVPGGHLQGGGCPECGGSRKKTTEEFIIGSKKQHGDVYDYSNVNYVNAKTHVTIICPKHGEFMQAPDSHLHGNGCPTCNSSKGALAVFKHLLKHQISYETEKRFDKCKYKKTLPFDFYIPKINLLIEFDGEQHYKPVEVFGGVEAFEKQQIKDVIKNKYAKENNYYLVRIRDINNIEIVLKPYIELYNMENPENYVICDGELFYDDLD